MLLFYCCCMATSLYRDKIKKHQSITDWCSTLIILLLYDSVTPRTSVEPNICDKKMHLKVIITRRKCSTNQSCIVYCKVSVPWCTKMSEVIKSNKNIHDKIYWNGYEYHQDGESACSLYYVCARYDIFKWINSKIVWISNYPKANLCRTACS